MPQVLSPRSKEEDFVRLTGFRLSSQALDDEKSCQRSNAGYENSAYSRDKHDKAESTERRADAAVGIDLVGGSNNTALLLSPMKGDHRQSVNSRAPPEQFHVIWQDLTYEVKQGAVERCLRELAKLFKRSASVSNSGPRHLKSISIDKEARSAAQQDSDIDQYRCTESSEDPGRNYIFKNLNGYIRSGEITAILGPSGAGKTSLLNAICGFGTQSYKGSLKLVGGNHKKRMQVSIIPQIDYLINNLTVHENLSYSSRILNVNRHFDHEANIDRVVKVLNLMNCVHTQCANLSGGEYKRVSIAQELLRQPDILVLDEPTSGLDSLNCKRLIKTLRDLIDAAERGMISPIAIVVTIHQPDIEIYSMFDHVYCLAPGGRVVFDGHPSETLDVIRAKGCVNIGLSDNQVNPANLLIEIASNEIADEATVNRLADHQRRSIEKHLKSLIAEANHSGYNADSTNADKGNGTNCAKAHRPSNLFRDKRLRSKSHDNNGLFWYHTSLLASRTFKGTIRNPMVSVLSAAFHTALPVIMWLIFSKRIGSVKACPKIVREISVFALIDENKMTDSSGILEELITAYEGATMFYISTYAYSTCCEVMSAMTFPLNMHILLKELRNGRYGMSTFVLSKTIANFPLEVVFPSLSLVLVYYLLDMPSSYLGWRMIAIGIIMAIVAMIAATIGLVFGALLMDDSQASVFLAVAATLPLNMLSGLVGRINQMPRWLQLLSWASPFRCSSDMILMVRYGFGMCPCEPETESYLKTTMPRLTDVPDRTKSVLNYYFSNLRNMQDGSDADDTATTTILLANNTDTPANLQHVPGVSYDYAENATLENIIMGQVNSGQFDLLKSVARVFSKLFSLGQNFEDCKSVRSQIMILSDIPSEDWILFLLCGLIIQLILWKIALYFAVRYKIGTRL